MEEGGIATGSLTVPTMPPGGWGMKPLTAITERAAAGLKRLGRMAAVKRVDCCLRRVDLNIADEWAYGVGGIVNGD